MPNAVQAVLGTWVATSGALTQSAWATYTFIITQQFEARVPVIFLMTNDFSFAPEVWVWRSTDYGTTWETQGSVVGVFKDDGLTTNRTLRRDIVLDTGWYLIGVCVGSHATQTFSCGIQTAWVVTAIE